MTEPKMIYLVDQYDRVPIPVHVLSRLLHTAAETMERMPAEAELRIDRVQCLNLITILKTLAYGHEEKDVKEWAVSTLNTLKGLVLNDKDNDQASLAADARLYLAAGLMDGNEVGDSPGRGGAGQHPLDGSRDQESL